MIETFSDIMINISPHLLSPLVSRRLSYQMKSSFWDAKEIPGRELEGGHGQSPQGGGEGRGRRLQEAAGGGRPVGGDGQTRAEEGPEEGESSSP